MFQDDILPLIGGMAIHEIEPMQILEVIRMFEDRGQWNGPIRLGGGAGKYSGMR